MNIKIIRNKIEDDAIIDSEIIQDIESVKNNGFRFNINCRDSLGYTLLADAIVWRRKELVEYLLSDPRINVNTQDMSGWTGLHDACSNNNIEIVRKLLLDARVDTSIRNEYGDTVRDIAIWEGYLGIANMLKRIGHTSLLRIPNASLCKDITRMIIEEYV